MTDNKEQRTQREAIQRAARQAAGTYRQLTRANGIANTAGDVRDAWRTRVTALEGRRDGYAHEWHVQMPHPSLFQASDPLEPAWLGDMVRACEVVVWQLDNEF